jgi:hypothetical protein
VSESWKCSCGVTVQEDPADADEVVELDGVLHTHDEDEDGD